MMWTSHLEASACVLSSRYAMLCYDWLNSRSIHAPMSDQNLSSLFLNEFVVDCRCFNHTYVVATTNEFQLLQTRTLKNIFRMVLTHLGTKTFTERPLRLYASGAIWNNWLLTRSVVPSISVSYRPRLRFSYISSTSSLLQ